MNHLKLIAFMGLTCVSAAGVNVLVSRVGGLDIFSFEVWLIVPLGAMFIGFLGTSGAIFAARRFKIRPTWIDALLMLMVALATVALIYYLDYLTLPVEHGRKIGGAADLKSYADFILMTRMGIDQASPKAGRLIEGGYYLAAIQLFGFVLGGAASLLLIRGMRTCAQCNGYVHKLKTTTTPVLNYRETTELLDLFETGDLGLVEKLVGWRPEETSYEPKGEMATITYDLYNCAECKSEELIVSVRTLTGKKWKDVPSLSARRFFVADSPLRHAFH